METFQFVFLQNVVADIIASQIAASGRRELAYRTIERAYGGGQAKNLFFSNYGHRCDFRTINVLKRWFGLLHLRADMIRA